MKPMTLNSQIVLASRPTGAATLENFRMQEVALAPLDAGQVRVRHHYLSLDPYMRGRMNEGKSYASPQPLNQPMVGGTVGQVVDSRHPGYAQDDWVVGMGGWQLFSTVDASQPQALHKIDVRQIPPSAYLGPVGMPGVTAWIGLNRIIEPQPGQTVCVDSASGAVGSVVGQLAKAQGCRVVGIAGGSDKCAYVKEELGFDDCLDYKQFGSATELAQALKQACPQGIDGHFENVGGMILDAVMLRMNAFGRIAFCGMIAGYDGQPLPMSYPTLILVSRLKLQGFIVSEHLELWPQALKALGQGVATGQIRYRETVAHGLEQAPQAFLQLLQGGNFGKQLVKLV